MSAKRIILSDSENFRIMCKEKLEIDCSDFTPWLLMNKTILDVLMNRDNCLDEIENVVLEEYCSVVTPKKRRYHKNMNKHTELDFENLSSISTTDHISDHIDSDKIGGTESIDSYTEETVVYSEEVINPDNNESLTDDIEVCVNPVMEETTDIGIEDELLKCVLDKEYFEKLECLPVMFLTEERIKRLSEMLSNPIGSLISDGTLKYKMFVITLCFKMLNECKLDVDDVYNNLLPVMELLQGRKNIFSESSTKLSIEQELFVSILDNCIYIIKYLNLEELVVIFKMYWSYFYNFNVNEMIMSKSYSICKEIVKRLQIEQIQKLLKFIAESFVNFNNNVYHKAINKEEISVINKSQTDEKFCVTFSKESVNVEKRIVLKSELGNKYFVKMVIILFERIFVGVVGEKDVMRAPEVSGEEESYRVFKDNLKMFVDEVFYREGVEFESCVEFMQILLEDLESPTKIFAPFIVSEMAGIFMCHVNYEERGVKRDAEKGISRRESKRSHSFKLLLIIARRVFAIYNEMVKTEIIGYLNSRYLDSECSRNGVGWSRTDGDMEGANELELEDNNTVRMKDYISSYIGYVAIDDSVIDNDVTGVCEFYILLKSYCHRSKVSQVDDLRLFIKMFKYLYKHNVNYKGDIEKVIDNMNYINVINYPYSAGGSRSSDGDDVNDAKVEELVHKLYVFNGVCGLHELVLDCVLSVVGSTNENSMLKLSIDFVSDITSMNGRYLLNANIRNFLMSSLSDYNAYVRQKIISIYSNWIVNFKSSITHGPVGSGVKFRDSKNHARDVLLKYVDKGLLSKIQCCTRDINYKIRLEAIKLLHVFLSMVGIEKYMDEVAILAQRTLDSNREHAQVKRALHNLLTSVFFKYGIELLDSSLVSKQTDKEGVCIAAQKNGGSVSSGENGAVVEANSCKNLIGDDNKVVLERLVNVLLYKMESYKSDVNPIMVMMSCYESDRNIINEPINYYVSGRCGQHGVIDATKSSTIRKGGIERNGIRNGKNMNKARSISRNRTSYGSEDDVDVLGLSRSEQIVSFWLNKLLDFFLYKRAEGSSYYELAEILSVYKMFGEVHPRLFVKHLVYFIPYFRIIDGARLEVNQVNLIVLINSLIIIVQKYWKKNKEMSTRGYFKKVNVEDLKDSKSGVLSVESRNGILSSDASGGQQQEVDEDDIFKELKGISESIVPLINCNSPILIRSIVQFMSYNDQEFIRSVCEVSYNYLLSLKKMMESIGAIKEKYKQSIGYEDLSERRMRMLSKKKALVHVDVYKNAWKLGCVCEFNEVDLKIMNLFVEMYKFYAELGMCNISGLFIECCCRYLVNVDNLCNISHENLKSTLNELYKHCIEDLRSRFGDLALVLYQLLSTYQKLSGKRGEGPDSLVRALEHEDGSSNDLDNKSNVKSPGELEYIKDTRGEIVIKNGNDSEKEKKKKRLLKVIYVITQKYISTFTSIVSEGHREHKDGGIESSNMIVNERFNKNSIRRIRKGGCEKDKVELDDNKRVRVEEKTKFDQEKSKLYMDIIEIIAVNRLTNVQELVPFVFSNLLSTDIEVRRVAENNLKVIIKQDVNMFLSRLNSCFMALLKQIIKRFFEYDYVLGLVGNNTPAAVQSILRIYVEMLQKRSSNVKQFFTSTLMQTKVISNQEVIESIRELVDKNSNFNYNNIRENGEGGESRRGKGMVNTMSSLVAKMKTARGEERNECVVEYLLHLYVNFVCVLLDGIVFKSKKEASFAVERIKDVVEENYKNSRYTKINTLTQTRLKKISNSIKTIYK